MNLLSISLLIIAFKINLSKANNIIQISAGNDDYTNISTKYECINYSFFGDSISIYMHSVPYS